MSAGRFNLSALAVRERAITLFLILLISVAGVVSFFKLGRAEDPAFTIKVMTVITAWPGATAQEMQDQVAEKLEKRLQELRWYERSETYTRPGLAFTTLTLQDSTPPAEVQEQFYQARKKVGDEAGNLPQGVIGPMVNDEYADVTFALFALKAKASRNACWCAMPRRCASACCMCQASRRSTSSASSRSASTWNSRTSAWPRWAWRRSRCSRRSTTRTC